MDEAAILDASPIILLARAGFLDFLSVLNRPLVVLRLISVGMHLSDRTLNAVLLRVGE